jgi:mannose-6-phosphate isomerase
MIQPFKLTNTYRDYVWGGHRLRPGKEITAEAWIVYEGNQIATGPDAGKTLLEVAEREKEALLGTKPLAQTGLRFPLLIKLLDCNQWLSLQVHPNDEQAKQLEGPQHFGKTEAWYVIEAEKDAQLISGFRSGVDRDRIAAAVRGGGIMELVARKNVLAGDIFFIAPGTLHALGPGLLIYEVQQTSDITYRVYDWDRPKSAGRKLHIEEAIAVLDPEATGKSMSESMPEDAIQQLVSCEYFALDLMEGESQQISLDTKGQSFSALTVVAGKLRVTGNTWVEDLHQFARALNAYVPVGL